VVGGIFDEMESFEMVGMGLWKANFAWFAVGSSATSCSFSCSFSFSSLTNCQESSSMFFVGTLSFISSSKKNVRILVSVSPFSLVVVVLYWTFSRLFVSNECSVLDGMVIDWLW